MTEPKVANPSIREQVMACCRALDDKKAENIRVLHMGALSSIADYFIIATGAAEPHLRALAIEVEKTLDDMKIEILGVDRSTKSGWVVVDAFDFIVHLFTEDTRKYYQLETLWRDAKVVEPELNPPAPRS
ncbi:MAG: ribosome silencing factor [Verrucomicrobiota bacterium JB022]|nr:ribosome silencing factor [Verrucomicrobiota bacterium JB022]